MKKRKTLNSSEAAPGRLRSAGRRVVSEGMRITKPGAFTKMKPQDPSFNPRSAADTWILHNDGPQNDLSAMHDNISVVAPLTSMDIISSSSSMTLSSATVLGRSSQHNLSDSHSSSQTDPSGTSRDSFAGQQREGCVAHPVTERCEDNGDVLNLSTHRANAKLHTQQRQTPNRRRARVLSQSPRLETINEEIELDAIYGRRHDPSSDGRRQDPTMQNDTSTVHNDEQEYPSDEYDVFEDGLSDNDLLHCQDEGAVSTSDNVTSEQQPAPIPRRSGEQHTDVIDTSPTVDDDYFDEDWGMLEDEDIHILEQAEASMERSTILNRVSSSTQKIHATPVTISSTCTKTNGMHPPAQKPILRPPFPDLVQDRSPIIGLSAAISLRTCFRIGEALNVGSQAVRERQSVIIELYARVRWSFREPRSVKQHFTFMDLFHDRPPYLDGVYEIWKGVELYEQDSGRFLAPSASPLICRCIGTLKRHGTSWKLTILNIWEATMDDVDYAIGLIQS